jgi:hypothetical protein
MLQLRTFHIRALCGCYCFLLLDISLSSDKAYSNECVCSVTTFSGCMYEREASVKEILTGCGILPVAII